MNVLVNLFMTYDGCWKDEPEFTSEIGQQALIDSGYRSGDRFTVAYNYEELELLTKKHGVMPLDSYACDIAIAEAFKLGIWSAGSFSDYYDIDKNIKMANGGIKIVIDIGFPFGELTRFQQFIFNTKRLLRYLLGC